MYANNEVGTIQSIKKMVQIARERNIIFHTDAVQAVGKIPIDVKELGVDLLSISSHKINGPKGVGALYIRNGVTISPLILGGGQENGLRSGTENVASIIGFGMACELAKNNMNENTDHLKKLTTKLTTRVLHEIPSTTLNGHPDMRTPNNTHFTFLGVNGEDLIIKLDENKISASTGSARSEEHTSELQSRRDLVCRLLLEKKKNIDNITFNHIKPQNHSPHSTTLNEPAEPKQ